MARVLGSFERNSLTIEDRIEERSICSFTIADIEGTQTYLEKQPIEIYDDEGELAFAGFIDSSSETRIAPKGGKYHEIKCVDMHYLADKIIAAESYENKTVGYIVDDLFDNYLAAEGITIGEIQAGPTLSTCIINYVRVSDAIAKLAEKAGFIWYISYDKKLYFVDRATYTAPWVITRLDINPPPLPKLTRSSPQYRNRQYIRGGKALTDLQTEEHYGDGKTRAFTLGYPVGKVPTLIEVDGVAKTVGIKGIDTGKQWYWSKSDPILYQDTSEGIVASNKILHVEYYGEYEIIVMAADDDAIADELALEGVGTGYVDDVADEPTITDIQAGIDSALAKLKQYSPHGRIFTFTTLRSGLKAGQLAPMNLPFYGLSNVEMLIEAITIRRVDGDMQYKVTAIEGPEMGGWSKLFKELASIGQTFVKDVNIGSGTVLIILKKFSGRYDVSSTLIPTEWACPIPLPTLYPSPTLYPC